MSQPAEGAVTEPDLARSEDRAANPGGHLLGLIRNHPNGFRVSVREVRSLVDALDAAERETLEARAQVAQLTVDLFAARTQITASRRGPSPTACEVDGQE